MLIIWNEAPMCHNYCFEAIDKSLKGIMQNSAHFDQPFRGKVVFGGDFRRILLEIPKGSCSDIVHASINSAYPWDHY
jgi:ATP-dependent DNA helicase PIF1